MIKKVLLLLLFLSIAVTACSKPPIIRNAETSAEKSYKTGVFYLKSKDYDRAEKSFMKVISTYTYSAYEPSATIALGQVYLARKEYAAAVEVFRRFLKMRPDHALSPSALYLLGHSYWEQRPSDFFLFPNPADKDLQDVKAAAHHFVRYKEKYPKGAEIKKVEKELAAAETMLMIKELRVAEYYARIKKCNSTKMRLAYLEKHYTVSSEDVKKRIAKLRKKCPGETPTPPKSPKPAEESTEKQAQ
ncbi:outer membrane protein assembly factor BamD [bacterium]|nr:outer membrane protein assembly factor BamD [bacterium]